MKTIFYVKKGRKYVPVSEYNTELLDALPKGAHLTVVNPGIHSTRYNIDPAFAPVMAAVRYAEDNMVKSIIDATDIRPSKTPLTPEQIDAWSNLSKAFGENNHKLLWPSAREAIDKFANSLQLEVDKMLNNPAVKNAYDEFMLLCKLTKDGNDKT